MLSYGSGWAVINLKGKGSQIIDRQRRLYECASYVEVCWGM